LITYISKQISLLLSRMASADEHIIRCSECGRDLIVKDTVNNGVAFLSHLKVDHGITFYPQRMVQSKTLKKNPPAQGLEDLVDK
jgi:hypothetical protein